MSDEDLKCVVERLYCAGFSDCDIAGQVLHDSSRDQTIGRIRRSLGLMGHGRKVQRSGAKARRTNIIAQIRRAQERSLHKLRLRRQLSAAA